MSKIYLICPVRKATHKQKRQLEDYTVQLTNQGHNVYYPAWDNPHEETDNIGVDICLHLKRTIERADEVHIYWNEASEGSLMDLGMVFMAEKPIKFIRPPEPTEGKSYNNVMLNWPWGIVK